MTIDNDFDGNFARVALTTAFDVPVRFCIKAAITDRLGFGSWRLGKQCRNVEADITANRNASNGTFGLTISGNNGSARHSIPLMVNVQ